MTSVVLSLICSCVFGEKKKNPKNRNNVAFFSYFQLRTPVEKVLPCGHPAVNECLLHHSLQRYPPTPPPPPLPHPIAQPSTCYLCCSGRCWPLLSVWHHLFFCVRACLWNIRLYFCTIYKKKNCQIFVPWFIAWWSELFIHTYNINIHHCSEYVLKWKDASHSVGKKKKKKNRRQWKAVVWNRCVPAVEETGYTQEFDDGKITAEFPACFLFLNMKITHLGNDPAPIIKENC